VRGRIWILGALLVAAALAVAALRPASELMVDHSCELDSPVGKLKSFAQGRAFWEGQIEHLEREIAWYASAPKRQARLDKSLAPILANADRALAENRETMEKLYEQHPDLRPSAEQQAAGELRAQADALERADLNIRLDQMRQQVIRQLQDCRPAIEARLSR
jgi:hypothetical protein